MVSINPKLEWSTFTNRVGGNFKLINTQPPQFYDAWSWRLVEYAGAADSSLRTVATGEVKQAFIYDYVTNQTRVDHGARVASTTGSADWGPQPPPSFRFVSTMYFPESFAKQFDFPAVMRFKVEATVNFAAGGLVAPYQAVLDVSAFLAKAWLSGVTRSGTTTYQKFTWYVAGLYVVKEHLPSISFTYSSSMVPSSIDDEECSWFMDLDGFSAKNTLEDVELS